MPPAAPAPTDPVATLLAALHADPADHAIRLALADALEEAGRTDQAEVARLHARQLMRVGTPGELSRLCALLESGVRPVVPEVVNSIGMRLALIPPGTFFMGSPEGVEARGDNEVQHEVRITRALYLGVFPVTQAEYREVMGVNPSFYSSDDGMRVLLQGLNTGRFPVESVSHADATAFCERLSARAGERAAGRSYRLPTEAEWEHSCRGGAAYYQAFHVGDSLGSLQANFDGSHPDGSAEPGPYLERPSEVGSYAPNAFGLFDMHGNVWEWCADWYDKDYHARSPADDPAGPHTGSHRVYRGGGFGDIGCNCRSATRFCRVPNLGSGDVGFRVVVRSGQAG